MNSQEKGQNLLTQRRKVTKVFEKGHYPAFLPWLSQSQKL
jgi:ribosomal protein L24E